jgi:hypothetical protein
MMHTSSDCASLWGKIARSLFKAGLFQIESYWTQLMSSTHSIQYQLFSIVLSIKPHLQVRAFYCLEESA